MTLVIVQVKGLGLYFEYIGRFLRDYKQGHEMVIFVS